MRLAGKRALITGGAAGFGAGIASTFVREGAKVVLLDLNGPLAQETASKLGDAALGMKGDVTHSPDVAAAVALTVESFGGLDIVVNNAGWTHRNKPMLDVTEEEFEKLYATNVRSIFHMTRSGCR